MKFVINNKQQEDIFNYAFKKLLDALGQNKSIAKNSDCSVLIHAQICEWLTLRFCSIHSSKDLEALIKDIDIKIKTAIEAYCHIQKLAFMPKLPEILYYYPPPQNDEIFKHISNEIRELDDSKDGWNVIPIIFRQTSSERQFDKAARKYFRILILGDRRSNSEIKEHIFDDGLRRENFEKTFESCIGKEGKKISNGRITILCI